MIVLLFRMVHKYSSVTEGFAKHLTSDFDHTSESLRAVLDLAHEVKRTPSRFRKTLDGRYLALLFEKPSLRTRLTFELAMKQLGGDTVATIGPVGDREPVKDVARNLDRWTQGIVARVFSHSTIEELARWSKVPVINALSDLYHPCQALADVQTIEERFGKLDGLKLAFVGDGNNVAHSLMLTAGRLGMHVAVAAPEKYQPLPEIVEQASKFARITITGDPGEAVDGAHAVYTDVWASMGQESEAAERARIFAPFQVNETLLRKARPEAIFLHCLPAKRGQEVTDAVMESPQSALLLMLLK
ncbi:MAG: ornithine carbamoyltransferase [Bryobacteraceae bacterium]